MKTYDFLRAFHTMSEKAKLGKSSGKVFTLNSHLVSFLNKTNETSQQKFILGKVATTDVLPNPKAQVKQMNNIKVDVVEMEGASLMHVCWFFQKPCIVVRGASNLTTEVITSADIEMAANHAANVIIEIVKNYQG